MAATKTKSGLKAKKKDWFLYMIETENNLLYTGITKDLERRFSEHAQMKKGAKFFRRSLPKRRLFSISGLDHSSALKLEYAVKGLSRDKKLALAADKDVRRKLRALLKKL